MPQRMPGFSTQSIVFMERIFKALNIYLHKSDHAPIIRRSPGPGLYAPVGSGMDDAIYDPYPSSLPVMLLPSAINKLTVLRAPVHNNGHNDGVAEA